MKDPLRDLVLQMSARDNLLPRGVHVLAAVSGGADSAALLHVLAGLRADLGITLSAAHLDHGLRGARSAADARWVETFARQLDVPLVVERRNVREAARAAHESVETAARRERLAFLEQAAGRVGAATIALGHTRDDLVETVLMNILRGTGTDGLRGMAPVSGVFIRPLLCAARTDTEAYCRAHGIEYRTDETNLDLLYRRNRVRHELLPHLEVCYNPNVREALLRLSEIARAEADLLDAMAEERVAAVAQRSDGGAWSLPAAGVAHQPTAIARRMIRRLLHRVLPGLVDVHFEAVEQALASAAGTRAPMSWTIPGANVVLSANPQVIRVRRCSAPEERSAVETPLNVPGDTDIPILRVTVRAELLAEPAGLDPMRAMRMQTPTARIVGGLTVRTRRPGDSLRPIGVGGSRKVQDILTDHKTPAAERDGVPIIADEAGILWVVGHALDERARLEAHCGAVLRLTVQPLEPVTVDAS